MKIMLSSPSPGCGKDTVADYLVNKYGYTKVSFAGAIYTIANQYFDMKDKDRVLLQSIGEGFRSLDQDVWINEMERKIKDIEKLVGTDKLVISDLRQENEYLWGLKNNFLPIRISASLDLAEQRVKNRDGSCDINRFDHESERGAENKEMIDISNDTTKEELYQKIDMVMESLFA